MAANNRFFVGCYHPSVGPAGMAAVDRAGCPIQSREFVYGPLRDKFAQMSGTTLQKAFVPLPAGTAVYTGSGLAYYRHGDHLSSSRLATTPARTMYSSTA